MEEKKDKYKGLWPVMLTPFTQAGEVDIRCLEQLTEFYLEHGATGLFANCLSSEMFELSEKERIAIIKTVVANVKGKVPVAATGTFTDSTEDQLEFIKKISDLGVDVVVIVTGIIAGKEDEESVLKEKLMQLAYKTGDTKLGLYECPVPYKRIISPDLVNQLCKTGRFSYLKDTTCDTDQVLAKVKAAENSNLSIFNANTPTSLDTLKGGADGISPISANFYPELYSWLIRYFNDIEKSGTVEYLNRYLTLMDAVTRINYPMSAKVFLAKRGIKIRPVIRTGGSPLNYEEGKIIENLYEQYSRILSELSLI